MRQSDDHSPTPKPQDNDPNPLDGPTSGDDPAGSPMDHQEISPAEQAASLASTSGDEELTSGDSNPPSHEAIVDEYVKDELVVAELGGVLELSENEFNASGQAGSVDAAEPIIEAAEVVSYQTPQRRIKLPVILFFLTCASTFFVGVTHWSPTFAFDSEMSLMPLRRMMLTDYGQGLIYMICVMLILFSHEMGHFIATLIYKVPASLPIFLPFPMNPIGTFGAVIGMNGAYADRKQIFDIGLAGPLAGLVIALPVMIAGVSQLDFTLHEGGQMACQCPLGVKWMLEWIQPKGYTGQDVVWISQLNPMFAAGWVGFLITGLNMLPISQMDGGHVTYTIFGRAAHWIARLTMVGAIGFMVYTGAPTLILMMVLLLIVGTDHPPTRDDTVKLGWFRVSLGLVSLSIPILCFPPMIFRFM